jgi:pimeloyl-ACP methyl ester carboxylesterase
MIGYHQVGNGEENVLVLHGWLGDSSVFEPMIPFLDTAAFTYVFMDYRGYGRSKTLTGAYTIAEIAEDALALVDTLGWERFHLLGHSMGGMAVQWIAAEVPSRVKRMVGITPVPASGFPFDTQTEALFRGAKDNAANREMILMHTTGNRLSPAFGRVMAERSLTQTTPEAFEGYLTAWSATDFTDRVEGLAVPFRVIVGEHDPAVTVALMNDTVMRWFPNTELTLLSGAGHYPMVETPLTLATLCESWLQQKTLAGAL